MSTTVIGNTRWGDVIVLQVLDTKTDAIHYRNSVSNELLATVDNSGYVFVKERQVGKFYLSNDHWLLRLDKGSIESAVKWPLFKLPEFELAIMPALLELYGHG